MEESTNNFNDKANNAESLDIKVPFPEYLDITVSADSPQIAAAAANAIAERLHLQLEELINQEREQQNEILTTQIEKIKKQLNEARQTKAYGSPNKTQEAEARIAALEKIYTGLLMKYEEEQVIGSVETSGRNPSLVSPAAVPATRCTRTAQNAHCSCSGPNGGVFRLIEYWRSSAPGEVPQQNRAAEPEYYSKFNKKNEYLRLFGILQAYSI